MKGNRYCEIYDAFYDKEGEWHSIKCGDKMCWFCVNRPLKHSHLCKCLKEKRDEVTEL